MTPAEIQDWVADLAASGLAPSTVGHQLVALRRVCAHAVTHHILATNPCTGIALPSPDTVTVVEPRVLTPHQVDLLAGHLGQVAAPYGLLIRFAAGTGLRAGELTGLRVGDLDLAHHQVHVRRTVHRGRTGLPKSRRSVREVPLRDTLVTDLTTYLATHFDDTDASRSGDEAGLWPGSTRGRRGQVSFEVGFDYDRFYRNRFKPALATLADQGVPDIRFHDLRHTAASIWLAAGVPPYRVSRWLGHASLTVTDGIYGHLYPADYARDLAPIEAYLAHTP